MYHLYGLPVMIVSSLTVDVLFTPRLRFFCRRVNKDETSSDERRSHVSLRVPLYTDAHLERGQHRVIKFRANEVSFPSILAFYRRRGGREVEWV